MKTVNIPSEQVPLRTEAPRLNRPVSVALAARTVAVAIWRPRLRRPLLLVAYAPGVLTDHGER